MTHDLGYVVIDRVRYRRMEAWERDNPPESGVVSVHRQTAAERFWRWVDEPGRVLPMRRGER